MDCFIDKLDEANAALIRAVRKAMRRRVATANELVLPFYYGATLPDSHGILQGSGSQDRFILAAAIAQSKASLAEKGKGKLIIWSISQKQRPR